MAFFRLDATPNAAAEPAQQLSIYTLPVKQALPHGRPVWRESPQGWMNGIPTVELVATRLDTCNSDDSHIRL